MIKPLLLRPAGAVRRLLPLCLGLACLALLWREGAALDWQAVGHDFTAIPLWRWVAAALATAVSFWALAQYDLIAHRHLRTGVPPAQARNSGAAAIAMGQVIGFGPVVGGAVRWRLMPGLSQRQLIHLTGFVTLSFFAVWAVLALVWALPVLSGLGWIAIAGLPLTAAALGAVLLRFGGIGKQAALPSVPAAFRLFALCFIDLAFAALAFYLLLPADLGLPLVPFVAAFVLALGAGLVGGTPGGVGPFEMALLALLPQIETAALAAGLLAFRAVYYALPSVIAAAYVLRSTPVPLSAAERPRAPRSGARAEHAIAHQSSGEGLHADGASACLLHTRQSLALFLGPATGALTPLLAPLKARAKAQNRAACLYKITARDAAAARRAGWATMALCQEAVLDPADFSADIPARRQLRRALRKAGSAGVSTGPMLRPDWQAMTDVHEAWLSQNGPERGWSMGRFCTGYLRDKPLFGAWQDGRLIAFVSFVQSPQGLSLDLMRQRPDAPSGTMHSLVCAALEQARAAGIPELSLAALPHPRHERLAPDAVGLARFKRSFAPRWRALYIAAPNHAALILVAADLWLTIRNPAPLPTQDPTEAWDSALSPAAAPPEQAEAPLPLRLAS